MYPFRPCKREQLVTLLALTMYELYTISKANCWKNVNQCIFLSKFIDVEYSLLVVLLLVKCLFLFVFGLVFGTPY